MNIVKPGLLGILFQYCILGACAQSVSVNLKIDLKPFLSIGIKPEKKGQNRVVSDGFGTPAEIISQGPFQFAVRWNSNSLKNVCKSEIKDNKFRIVISPEYLEVPCEINQNKTTTRPGGRCMIYLFDNTMENRSIFISLTAL